MDAARLSPEPLLRDSFDGFVELVTTVFLDSIVFFTTAGFCALAPRVFVRITNRFARWNFSTQAQKDFCIVSAIVLAAVHFLLILLLALEDDTGVTPNAPSVFWAIMWSTGILVGVLGGFLAAAVIALLWYTDDRPLKKKKDVSRSGTRTSLPSSSHSPRTEALYPKDS